MLSWRHAGTRRSVTRTVKHRLARSVGRRSRSERCLDVNRGTDPSVPRDATRAAVAEGAPSRPARMHGQRRRAWQQDRSLPSGNDGLAPARLDTPDSGGDGGRVAESRRGACAEASRRGPPPPTANSNVHRAPRLLGAAKRGASAVPICLDSTRATSQPWWRHPDCTGSRFEAEPARPLR